MARALEVDPGAGLPSTEARERLERYGPNKLIERGGRPPWLLFLEQFTNPMIVVLLAAAVITAFIGDLKDTIAILAVVTLNGVVGFLQEYQAERAMEALKQMTSPSATVLRDGGPHELPAAEVVPGDVVLLAVGDVVAADLRLTGVQALRINEAALTGESEPALKTTEPIADLDGSLIAERRNIAFKGTAVTYGRGAGVAVATGMGTEIGKIADLLQTHEAGRTPLQRRLSRLTKQIAVAAFAVCAVVFLAGLAAGEPVNVMFLTAVSLAVSAIPESMPIVITVALALGARRMAARRALVRKLPAVETLGSVSVICSDKTGTLTENRMLVERVWTPAGEYQVGGEGYAPDGPIKGTIDPDTDPYLDRLAAVAAACNDAVLHAPGEPGGGWTATGDPTEAALLALAGKRGVGREDLERRTPRVAEVAFDAARRRMSTVHAAGDTVWVATKGALDALVPQLEPGHAEELRPAEEAGIRYASEGYRVLALADRTIARIPKDLESVESGLRLVGIVGMADPPRPESAPAIEACRGSGIVSVMITGDDPRTAQAIARRLGILDHDDGVVLAGTELDSLDDQAFAERVAGIGVYARANPEQKLRIVEAWKQRDATVAMTGDGVNDAPALRLADIGVAMGVTGTEVSKEAADMVLADDNFATIVHAVEEGRRIYDNIRRFLRYILATNTGEIWLWILALALGLPMPLLPLQILWINLVTDGLPSVALGVEPVERDAMRRPPRPSRESILAHGLLRDALWVGLLMGVVGVGLQAGALNAGWPWQTMLFSAFTFLQLGNALAVRSERESVLRLGVRTNPFLFLAIIVAIALQLLIVYLPPLQDVFGTQALTPVQLGVVFAASTPVFIAVELAKWVERRRSKV